MSSIEPRLLKGFRDFLPEKQIPRQIMINTIRASFESFGFEPLETPVLEYAEILTGKYGDEGDKLMYRFKDNGDRDVAMRYDLTIPLARVIAQYGELKRPFKRYQISPVWRADNTQKGRYREFYQCDADIVGSKSLLADAEILALASSTFIRLGVADFIVRVNSREIINSYYDSLGLSENEKITAIRIVDKMDKIGKKGVMDELIARGLSKQAESIVSFAETTIDALRNPSDLATVSEAFPSIKSQLLSLASTIEKAYGLAPDTRFVIDFSISRGLDYYTGIIFETNLIGATQYGSVLSGGRYDNLVGTFSNKSVPVVGMSIGLDRLIAALEELKLIEEATTTARALIVNFDESLESEYLKLARTLRTEGINTILYLDSADLKKQLSYASDKRIKYAVIYGSNEAKTGKALVKNLEEGTQTNVELDNIANFLKK